MTDDELWNEAVKAVSDAYWDTHRRTDLGVMQPPHCVTMKNRYSRRLEDTFHFDTEQEARDFIKLLRRAHYAGTADTDYVLRYRRTDGR